MNRVHTSNGGRIAPCNSSESDGEAASRAASRQAQSNGNEASSPPTKDFENETNIKDVSSTLPGPAWIQRSGHDDITVTRPVMCAVPDQRKGSRSEGTASEAGTASGVTSGEGAERVRPGGASVAGPAEPEQAQPAQPFGNEAIENEGAIENAEIDNEAIVAEVASTPNAHLIHDVERNAAFEVVRSARGLMQQIDRSREARKDTPPSAATIEKYKKQAKLVLQLAKMVKDGSSDLPSVCVALADYSSKANSFYTMRAAMSWLMRDKMTKLLAEQNQLQRSGGTTRQWAACVDMLAAALQVLSSIHKLDIESAREFSGRRAVAATSKREVLRHADEDWRDRYFRITATSEEFRHAALFHGMFGMRPEELQRGVVVWRRGPLVAIKVTGAKVRDTAGQPWRGMLVKATKFPPWFLHGLDGKPKVYSARKSDVRDYFRALSPYVFPRVAGERQLSLSPSVLRHAIATDLRQAGWESAEISAVIGHCSAATSRWYGLRWRGSKSRRQPDIAIERGLVETARPVRQRQSTFLDEKKSASKKKANRPANR